MWIVIHFLDEDSVESVPETWYNRKTKTCAWPISKKNAKKLIEKKTYPNKLEYNWLPARILGRKYGSLEEARAKANKALILSDLSANDGYICKKVTRKTFENKQIESPPTLKSKKRKNDEFIEEDENSIDMYDSDKDAEYHLPGVSNDYPKRSPMIRNYNNVSSSPNIFNSPVGKFLVEDDHHDSPINHLMTSPSPKQNKSTIFMSQPNKLTPDTPVSKTLMTNNVKKKLCFSQPSNLSEGIHSQQIKNNVNNNSSTENNEIKNGDFQNLVLTLLSKIKYEISNLSSTLNIQQTTINAFDTFLKNTGQTIASQISNQSTSITIDDIFPIKTEEELEIFEERIKSDKIFRNTATSKLSVLIGIKDIGDSTRRLMSKMIVDEVLCNYSLLGFKKKKNFSQLSTYRLLIDTIRLNPKFQNKLDKEIDVPLATWLSHAKFRLQSS
ncbi:DUF4806 domain-containing protein [Aphis craccivora]|uniref:DUF4806 domain-containing protein n=1 Tax=Aphis craccivora TaxID=307492 RepID=A0A6G0WYR0_APHCR|nr:DUF4806 domain-containing protein [Aphis craccivora]